MQFVVQAAFAAALNASAELPQCLREGVGDEGGPSSSLHSLEGCARVPPVVRGRREFSENGVSTLFSRLIRVRFE